MLFMAAQWNCFPTLKVDVWKLHYPEISQESLGAQHFQGLINHVLEIQQYIFPKTYCSRPGLQILLMQGPKSHLPWFQADLTHPQTRTRLLSQPLFFEVSIQRGLSAAVLLTIGMWKPHLRTKQKSSSTNFPINGVFFRWVFLSQQVVSIYLEVAPANVDHRNEAVGQGIFPGTAAVIRVHVEHT